MSDGFSSSAYRRKPERKTTRNRLVIDMVIPLPCAAASELCTRIVVVGIVLHERMCHNDPWKAVGCKYVVGTPDAFYVKGFAFPFKLFDAVLLTAPTNPYEAANLYVKSMATVIRRLVPSPEALRYVSLKRNHDAQFSHTP